MTARNPGQSRIAMAGLMALAAVALSITCAHAEADLFQLERPGTVNLTLFLSGYGSDKYGTTHGGVEVEQSITRYVSLLGRISSYQVYEGTGFDNPLLPAGSGTRNLGRFEGGVDLLPMQGLSLVILGGRDVGDSNAPVLEGDFSAWLMLHSRHPLNASFSASHFYENEVTSSRIDLRSVLLSTGRLMLLAGAGGAIWGGGSVGAIKGQGGPDLGIFLRKWRTSIDLQVGYGSSNGYGLVSFSRQLHWEE
jgi:hypothetical protein